MFDNGCKQCSIVVIVVLSLAHSCRPSPSPDGEGNVFCFAVSSQCLIADRLLLKLWSSCTAKEIDRNVKVVYYARYPELRIGRLCAVGCKLPA